jgi:thiamine biosynthesis lipoprotein ApbE
MRYTADSLETAELLPAEADAAHDAVQRAGLEVAIVDGTGTVRRSPGCLMM